MAGKKKKKGAQKPLTGKKAHKASAAYIKPDRVGVDEKAGRSKFRQKKRIQQHGGPDGQKDHGFQFVEAARPVSNGFMGSEESKPRYRGHESYRFDHANPARTLITESYNGPASRKTTVFYEEIGPVGRENMRFKPCFLVAEKLEEQGQGGIWQISRYTGHSDPEAGFRGEIDFIAEVTASEREVAEELVKWCKNAGNQPSSVPNYVFQGAQKVSSGTEVYGWRHDRRAGRGFSDFRW